MSAQHTPGRMELVRCNCGHPSCNRSGTNIGIFYQGSGYDLPDAQRVVDCWNACEGIADPSVVPELVAELDCRVGDLVMLRRAIGEGDPRSELFVRIDDMLRESRAILAKARGAA